jgi:hypothetical protein
MRRDRGGKGEERIVCGGGAYRLTSLRGPTLIQVSN